MSSVSKKTSSQVALKVEHVSKSFHLPNEKASGIKQAFINYVRGVKGYTEQRVLKDISFEIEKGDFFGIVGRNGSGKSTLLKLISQIYTPDSGKIIVNGSLVPFIELGVGFNPELTGRENVYLNGAMLGFSTNEIDSMYDEIVEFAELHDFMDQKLKNYSSGMQVRLAFSVAIKAQGDILVLDEVLAVGDEAFQKKCFQYFAELKKNKKTVILVTHSMESVQNFCNKALMINGGSIVEIGNPSTVAQAYRELFMTSEAIQEREIRDEAGDGRAENGYLKSVVKLKQDPSKLEFDIKVDFKKSPETEPIVAFGIVRDTGEQVYRWASDEQMQETVGNSSINLVVTIDNIFPEGDFGVLLVVKSRDRSQDYGTFNNTLLFTVRPRTNLKWDTYWKPAESFTIKSNINSGE